MINNTKNNTISEIYAKKDLNKLNEIKNVETMKYKKRTPGHKELLNLFNDLLDIILTDKTLENQENENEKVESRKEENEKVESRKEENEYENEDDYYENENEDEDYENKNEYEDEDEDYENENEYEDEDYENKNEYEYEDEDYVNKNEHEYENENEDDDETMSQNKKTKY